MSCLSVVYQVELFIGSFMFYLLIYSRRKHNFREFMFLCVKAKLLWKQFENSWKFLKISSFSWMDLRYVFPLKTLCDNFEFIFLFKAILLSKKYQILIKFWFFSTFLTELKNVRSTPPHWSGTVFFSICPGFLGFGDPVLWTDS